MSSFQYGIFRGSIPSTFRLTAYLLAILRLKLYVTIEPPRTRYPVAGLPSGAGFPPAGLHDLARPHNKSVTFFLTRFFLSILTLPISTSFSFQNEKNLRNNQFQETVVFLFHVDLYDTY